MVLIRFPSVKQNRTSISDFSQKRKRSLRFFLLLNVTILGRDILFPAYDRKRHPKLKTTFGSNAKHFVSDAKRVTICASSKERVFLTKFLCLCLSTVKSTSRGSIEDFDRLSSSKAAGSRKKQTLTQLLDR